MKGRWTSEPPGTIVSGAQDRVFKRISKHVLPVSAICIVLALPIAAAAVRVNELKYEIGHLEREKIGLQSSLIAGSLLATIERYRMLQLDRQTALATGEHTSFVVAQELRELREPANRSVSDRGPRTHLAALEHNWQAVLTIAAPADRIEATIPLGEQVLKLMLDIDDASGLTYDPSVESINLSDALAARLPSQAERRDQSAEVVELARAAGRIGPGDIIRGEMLAGEAHDALGAAADDYDGAIQALPEIESALRFDRTTMLSDANKLAAAVNAVILHPTVANTRSMQRLRVNSADAGERLSRATERLLSASFDARIAAHQRSIALTIALGGGAGLLSFVLIAAVSRALRRRDRLELARVQERAEGLEMRLARRNAERALRLTEQQFRAVFDSALVGIAMIDCKDRRLEPNDAFRALFDDDFRAIEAVAETMLAALRRDGNHGQRTEQRFERVGRSPLWVEISMSLIRDEEREAVTAIVMVHDISVHKTLHEQLDYQTLHDELTALPNRILFMRRLEALVAARLEPFAVVFIDLDHFKAVNDTLGHRAGDQLLCSAARRLSAGVRACDFVARLHGDEFALLLCDVPDASGYEVDAIIARLERSLCFSVDAPDSTLVVSASIGVVRSRNQWCDAEEYLAQADAAMYRSKLQGRGCATFYDA